MTEMRELFFTTTCTTTLGVASAEVFRWAFHYLTIADSKRFGAVRHLHEFVHSAISAFILIVCAHEKGLLLWAGYKITFFAFTFVLLLVYFRIFSIHSPSPCHALEKHWMQIYKSGTVLSNNQVIKGTILNILSLYKMTLTYFRLGAASLLGQYVGLKLAIMWLKYCWNGWLTVHHETSLPILDECMVCLNTHTLAAVIVESLLTFVYLYSFEIIDKMLPPQNDAGKVFSAAITKNSIKGAIILIAMYLFMDITGAFANPFLALSLQRHCMSDFATSSAIIFVYGVGPFIATAIYLRLRQTDSAKAKASV
ncbi:uncharacterized protein LOC143451508 [Clavelina lepadiformis]|uniref:Aquaporin n=1 Tax=Clavelina lepadiformis TaxID=159417 RepID=A0ABP0H188_CLALP